MSGKPGRYSLSLGEKAFALVIAAMAALIIYRTVNYWITGFYVSDEFGYYYAALHGSVYGGRLFFGWFNIAVFRFFQVRTVDGFAFFLPFYLFFWSALAVSAFYKVLRLLKFNERTIALSLFSSLFLVSYVLLSLGFLTDSVGLSLVMVGIYFLLKFGNTHEGWRMLSYSFLALLFFGAASYTREPYSIILIGGALPVLFFGVKQVRNRGRNNSSFRHRRVLGAVLVLAVMTLYVGGTVYFIGFSPAPLLGQLSAAEGGVTGIFGNPIQITTVTIHSSTTVSGTTQSTTSVSTSQTTTTSTSQTAVSQTTTTMSSTSQTTTSLSSTQGNGTAVISLNPEAANTLQIFFGGIVLGWGPVLAIIAAVGLVSLFKGALHNRQGTPIVVLFLALLSLASYFVVSAIFSPDPGYLSFTNYSTIIRFSDTATPAYFLAAPFAFSLIQKRRLVLVATVCTLVAFMLLAVPTYETYAASHLSYTSSNPFNLGYRTPGMEVADYFQANHVQGPINMIGEPFGWYFAPGLHKIPPVNEYSYSGGVLSPSINSSQFEGLKWTTFYIFIPGDARQVVSQAPWLSAFIPSPGPVTQGNSALPFRILSSEVVINDPAFSLIRVQLSWN